MAKRKAGIGLDEPVDIERFTAPSFSEPLWVWDDNGGAEGKMAAAGKPLRDLNRPGTCDSGQSAT
jgi:hypothetical protein